MIAIWKFPIEIKHEQMIEVPEGAKVIHVGLDPKGVPCVWCSLITTNPRVEMPVAIVGTGHPLPQDGIHRGSFNHGPYVWHVFTHK